MKHPNWALQHKKPGTELRFINEKYYLYEVSSRWNPEKKRAQKITGKMLGRITETKGFVVSSKKLKIDTVQAKEYGAYHFIMHHMKESVTALEKIFPDCWEQIISSAIFRLLYQSPLKNMAFHFSNSFISEHFNNASLSPKQMGTLLKNIGSHRDKILSFFQTFITADQHLLIDVTHMHSNSHQLPIAKIGYNSQRDFNPQVNLMLIFSSSVTLPVYYRIVPGNIRDVKAFKLSLQESGVDDAVLVADKGFHSNDNVAHLDENQLRYILPLRRNNVLLDYSCLEQTARKGMQGYFKYKDRYVWYSTKEHQNKQVIIFLDESLRTREEQDYLGRIDTHPEEYSLESFQEKHITFGTLAMITNLTEKKPDEIYEIYKSRIAVEVMAGTLKNLLDADKSYMRDEKSLEGWMFINYIALFWYYKIYYLLKQHQLLSKISPNDLLMHLAEIKKIKINQKWFTTEITNATKKLLERLDMHIT